MRNRLRVPLALWAQLRVEPDCLCLGGLRGSLFSGLPPVEKVSEPPGGLSHRAGCVGVRRAGAPASLSLPASIPRLL